VAVTVTTGVAIVVVTAVTPLQEQAEEYLAAGSVLPRAGQAVPAQVGIAVGVLVVKVQAPSWRATTAMREGSGRAFLFRGKVLTAVVTVAVSVAVTVEVQGVTVEVM
jgi:hypothetical protein